MFVFIINKTRNVDGALGVLTANGQPDTTFSPTSVKLFDFGGPTDILWDMALAPSLPRGVLR